MQDLSQLIEDCLLPLPDTDVALIDDSLQGQKLSCITDLTASTLEEMLLLDKAVVPDNEADKAADVLSLFTADELEESEKDNSISTSTHGFSTLSFNETPKALTPSLAENRPLEGRDVLAMASRSLQEDLPLESITNTIISHSTVLSPALNIQSEKPAPFKITASGFLPRATTLPIRNTDEVMAELQRPLPASRISPSILNRRQQPSYASEAAKSESAISNIPQAQISSATKGQPTPDDGSFLEEEDGFGSSDGEEVQPIAKPRKITERKRRLNAIADSYMQERTQKQLKEGTKLRPEDDGQKSARSLINQSEDRQIISSPREYQVELFEKAKEKNIIAVLDTGLHILSDFVASS
jgi:endoribonuclease Dicer